MKRKKIVTIGGGTGSYTLLLGLKKYPVDLTAIVSMADDGGSTGRLRDELGVLPPGDVRQCLVALSDSSRDLRRLMQYRFESGDLKGHNFGNILLSALEKTYGGLFAGVEEAAKILNVRGRVIPVTEGDMRLKGTLENGEVLLGEDALDENVSLRKKGIPLVDIQLQKPVRIHKEARKALSEADVIIFGPADHFSNLVPMLLVQGFAKEIAQSKAQVFYVANLTNKKGLTQGWTLDDYIQSLEKYLGKGRFDAVFYNVSPFNGELQERYEKEEGENSIVTMGDLPKTYRLVRSRIVSSRAIKEEKGDLIASTRSYIRHDSDKLAKAIMLYLEVEGQKIIEDII